ncbi:hypothetical protein C1646_673060 [Rhizophagus diaphanus]|nr:hypothetical protein C1646_673060 [Rhizophagus diaphanus] [Rhizophagus sp. MUCL 43196]
MGNICIQDKFSKSWVITLDASRVTIRDQSRVNPGCIQGTHPGCIQGHPGCFNSTAFDNPGVFQLNVLAKIVYRCSLLEVSKFLVTKTLLKFISDKKKESWMIIFFNKGKRF